MYICRYDLLFFLLLKDSRGLSLLARNATARASERPHSEDRRIAVVCCERGSSKGRGGWGGGGGGVGRRSSKADLRCGAQERLGMKGLNQDGGASKKEPAEGGGVNRK